MSLEEPSLPEPLKYPEDLDREINRYTLLGEYESVFLAPSTSTSPSAFTGCWTGRASCDPPSPDRSGVHPPCGREALRPCASRVAS
ncbi:MAG: hypothetical protein ACXU86_02835 [Archangium sp.]